jgi:intracellular sulfur oxidation DsrE/DsrF family protein
MIVTGSLLLTSMGAAYAYHDEGGDDDHGRDQPCPVEYFNGIPLDTEFGPGTEAITHCLKTRHHAKVVIAVDSTHPMNKDGVVNKSKATFLSNIELMIANYEQVHHMEIGKDVKIIVVASSSGGLLMTKRHKAFGLDPVTGEPNPNPFVSLVERGLEEGFKFYLCQMAARELGIKTDNVIPGVEFVTGGHIAVADLQMLGYALIKP